MTEKSGKKKTKKGAKAAADPSVLGTLRSTRPTRIGGERRGATATRAKASAPKPAAARATTTKSSKPTRSSATRTKTSSGTTARAKPAAATRPEPPPLRPPPPPPQPRGGRPSGTEIVTTAVQAAGEIAQIGVTVGRQVLKRAAGRIPRP